MITLPVRESSLATNAACPPRTSHFTSADLMLSGAPETEISDMLGNLSECTGIRRGAVSDRTVQESLVTPCSVLLTASSPVATTISLVRYENGVFARRRTSGIEKSGVVPTILTGPPNVGLPARCPRASSGVDAKASPMPICKSDPSRPRVMAR